MVQFVYSCNHFTLRAEPTSTPPSLRSRELGLGRDTGVRETAAADVRVQGTIGTDSYHPVPLTPSRRGHVTGLAPNRRAKRPKGRREAESRHEGPSRAGAARAARIARGWAGPMGFAEHGRREVDAQRCLARRLPVHI